MDVLIVDARLWDGTGSPVQDDVDVRIRDGHIVEIGRELARDGAQLLDAAGATVLPGLIDAHVHLSMDPGSAWRTTTPEQHEQALRTHLRAYLAAGFTTILDPAVLPDEHARIRSAIESGAPGPRYLALGTPFSPPGGYVAVVIPAFPSVASPAEVEAQLDALVAEGVDGVKVTVEDGLAGPVWPLHSDAVFTAIHDGAERRGLPVYAHAMTPKEQLLALEKLHPYAFVHPPDRPDRKALDAIVASGVYETSTLSVFDGLRGGFEPERFTDSLVELTVPVEERATALDRDVKHAFGRQMIATAFPHAPLKGTIGRLAAHEFVVGPRVRRAQRSVLALSDSGVPLVLGSDSGNWPIIPYLFHGPTSVRELELLGEAGLSPEQALTAATRTPARMVGIEAGTIEVGRLADLIVVEGDPLQDLSAVRTIRWTVRAGVAHTPAEWLVAEAPHPVAPPPPFLPVASTSGERYDVIAAAQRRLHEAGDHRRCRDEMAALRAEFAADVRFSDADLEAAFEAHDPTTLGHGDDKHGPMPYPTEGTACSLFGLPPVLHGALNDRAGARGWPPPYPEDTRPLVVGGE